MPPLEEAELCDYITLFPFIGIDRYGHVKVGNGVEIRGRWVNVDRQVIESDSSVINIVADISIDRRAKVGSLLWNGRLADYQDGTGTADNELCEIRLERIVPDIKGRTTHYAVSCSRFLQKKDITS